MVPISRQASLPQTWKIERHARSSACGIRGASVLLCGFDYRKCESGAERTAEGRVFGTTVVFPGSDLNALTRLKHRKNRPAIYTGARPASAVNSIISRVQCINLHILSQRKSKDCLNGRRFLDEPKSEVICAETPENQIFS